MNQDKIGKFLASLRKENNLTQEDIAEKLNVNVKSVSRWENGRNLPDPSIMKEICKIYNVSINELFNGEKVKKSQDLQGQTECETPCPAGGWGQQHRNHGRQHQVF